MSLRSTLIKSVLSTALISALLLVGGVALGVMVGMLLHDSLPMHVPQATRNFFSALPMLVILGLTGAGWGYVTGRITGSPFSRRMAWSGGLSYGPGVIMTAIGLSVLEVQFVQRSHGPDFQIHRLYTLLFVPATFIVAGLGGLALGLANKNSRLAARLALSAGLAAAMIFLAIDLLMDALGMRVGAPGAAERVTMLTVTLVGSLGAAMAGGAVIGYFLQKLKSSYIVE